MRGRRLLVAAYPPSFRERYADELDALLDDTGVGPREVVDLLLGAARAWLRPAYGVDGAERRRRRLLSSVSVVWVAFCTVVCGTAGTLRLLEDPPVTGFDPHDGRWALGHEAAADALLVAAVLVLVAAVPLGLRALRSSAGVRRVVVGPVAGLAVLLLTFAGLQGYVVVAQPGAELPRWFLVAGAAWLLASAGVAAWWTVALPRALRLAGPAAPRLRVPALLSAAVALLLSAPAVLVLAVAVRTGSAWGTGYAVVMWVCVAGVLTAWLAGLTSASRGVAALRVRT
ncbi:MAG TPA: hypothetical protein VLV82_05240 [Candidatus Angelobacter sp.]|nr:hypothetical protein [Candidatus Angelobacter sp.]